MSASCGKNVLLNIRCDCSKECSHASLFNEGSVDEDKIIHVLVNVDIGVSAARTEAEFH